MGWQSAFDGRRLIIGAGGPRWPRAGLWMHGANCQTDLVVRIYGWERSTAQPVCTTHETGCG